MIQSTTSRLRASICWAICWALLLMAGSVCADTTLTSGEWIIETQDDRGRLTIKHKRLGVILRDVQLNIQSGGNMRKLRELKQWKVEVAGPQPHTSSSRADEKKWTPESGIPGRLLVRTVQPASTWSFEPTGNSLKISSTAPGAVLTGQAPVSKARRLARLLEPDGVPVTWQGTGECAGTYGGGYTRVPSFLPRENPECMYFALGQVY